MVNIKMIRIGIILLVGIIAVGLIWYFQIRVKFTELNNLRTVSTQKTEELNRILTLKPKLEEMRVSVARLQEEMDSLEAVFPKNPDVPGLITDVTKVARTKKISIMNFRPDGTQQKDYYVENHYAMSILGAYHNVGHFFSDIANFDLLINLDKVSVKASPTLSSDLQNFERYSGPKGSDDMVNSIQVVFRLTTYSSLSGAGK